MGDYQDKLLNLKQHVIYVGLSDPHMGTMGKIIDYSQKTQFTANSKTAAMLLYLLGRDNGDDIHFNTLKDKVKRKYGLNDADATAKINDFLTELDGHKVLSEKGAGNNPGTGSPDPLNLFSYQDPWDPNPGLIPGPEPISKATHHYSTGYVAITIFR